MRAAPLRRYALLWLALLAALAGCAGSDDGTRLYVLSPTAASGAKPMAGGAGPIAGVVVAGVRLPRYLDRPQIVTRSADNRIDIAELHQWGGDLGQDLTRVLAQNLSALLRSERVVAAPHALRAPDALRVEVEVLAFERIADGRVRLAARWWLTRGAEPAPIDGTRNTELYGAPLASSAGVDALVGSMSQVYGDFARTVAQAILAGMAARP